MRHCFRGDRCNLALGKTHDNMKGTTGQIWIGRPDMTYLAIGLTTVWLVGIAVFAGRFLNFTRLLYNNLDPARDLSKTGIFSSQAFFYPAGAQAIAPSDLTELGRQYQKQAIRDERLALAWGIGGFVLLTGSLAPSGGTLVAIGTLVAVAVGSYFWTRRIRLGKATKIEGVLARGLDALTFLLPMK